MHPGSEVGREGKLVKAGFEELWIKRIRKRVCKQQISKYRCSKYQRSEKFTGPEFLRIK